MRKLLMLVFLVGCATGPRVDPVQTSAQPERVAPKATVAEKPKPRPIVATVPQGAEDISAAAERERNGEPAGGDYVGLFGELGPERWLPMERAHGHFLSINSPRHPNSDEHGVVVYITTGKLASLESRGGLSLAMRDHGPIRVLLQSGVPDSDLPLMKVIDLAPAD